MNVHTRNSLIFALFFIFVAGNKLIFAQIRPPTVQDAINSRSSPLNRNRDKRADEEYERRAWEAEQRRLAEEEAKRRNEAIRNRPSSVRRTDEGFQSPMKLNQALEALQPGHSIELHGDLFTAFDGMILSATYYRGANGKDSVPVVLLHGKGGSRRDFDPIIPELLKAGMAVLVPDIRGHGKSVEFIVEEFGEPFPRYYPEFPIQEIPENPLTRSWLPDRWAGYQRMSADQAGGYRKPPTKISAKRYDSYDERDFRLRAYDLQVWQNFLVNENNQERLNLKKLNLVGVEMGAGLALLWCRCDGGKQAKTLTLISPVIPANAMDAKNGNITHLPYLNHNVMRNSISTMVIVGKENKRALDDAEKVKTTLLGKGNVDNETGLKAKYPFITCNTEKQGRDLFSLTSAQIDRGIPLFINDRLVKLEATAAEKKNDNTLAWARLGNWNVKAAPPPEKSATSSNTTKPTGASNVTTPTGTTNATNRQN